MTQPYVAYAAAAGQRDFDVPFPYINRSHVKVRVNGTPTLPLSWLSATRLRLPDGVAAGAAVEIERNTPTSEQLVKFQDGNILTAEDLNIAVQQLLYKQQEVESLYDRSLRNAQVRLGDNLGIVTNPEDVAQELAELVLEDQVLDNFRARIADIDLNADAILAQAFNVEANAQAITAQALDLSRIDQDFVTLRGDHDGLVEVVEGLIGGEPGSGVLALIQEERDARIAGDQAIVTTLDLIGAKSGDNLSFILDTSKVKVSPSESLAQRLSVLTAADGANLAAIQSEQTARIDADAALTTSVTTLGSRMTTNEAAIVTEQSARASGDAAEATARQALAARVDITETDLAAAEAAIVTEQTARANGDAAEATARQALAARVTNAESDINAAEAAIIAEQAARAGGDAAEATARLALAARVTTAEADINTVEAAVLTEQTARANGDNALSSNLTALTARVTTAEGNITTARADILSEQTARANGDSANATAINGLLTRMTAAEGDITIAEAAIVTEQNARVSGDNALASNISVLSTSLNGNIASVSTLQSSVNGLQARYGVSLDVNGYVTGFVQNNDGATGSFVILADRFAIVTPGNSPQVPFEVSGGVVRIKEANIGNLNVSKLTSGALGANITQNGDWLVGTGRIVWDNGSHMKVAGVGFGSANQFIEWFGPKMAISLCSEANAITYLKTNGDAYFGGALSAGVRKNAARSTQVSASASISTGIFGSAGGARTVIVSYESMREVEISGSCDGSGTPSVTIELRRNGTLLSTFSASGSTLCSPGFGTSEPGYWRETLTGSWTFTDTGGGLSPEYTATVTSRPLSTAPSSTMGLIAHTQSLGVISTE